MKRIRRLAKAWDKTAVVHTSKHPITMGEMFPDGIKLDGAKIVRGLVEFKRASLILRRPPEDYSI